MKGKEEKEEITLYAQYKSVFNIQYRLFLLQHQEALVFRYYYYYNIALCIEALLLILLPTFTNTLFIRARRGRNDFWVQVLENLITEATGCWTTSFFFLNIVMNEYYAWNIEWSTRYRIIRWNVQGRKFINRGVSVWNRLVFSYLLALIFEYFCTSRVRKEERKMAI